LTIEDRSIVGQARFERDIRKIHGTIVADGGVGATIGFDHLTGSFVQGSFEGAFERAGCVYKVILTPKSNRIDAAAR
jgi:hypothetical protein